MSLKLTKNPDQTWREAAIAQATRFGMQGDVAEYFDRFVALGDDPAEAAWSACYEWDVLDFVEENDAPAVVQDPGITEPGQSLAASTCGTDDRRSEVSSTPSPDQPQ